MWVVFLMILALTAVRAAKLQYCQELVLKGTAVRKDVATVFYTMDDACVSCYQEIRKLVRLKMQMAKLGHNADVLVGISRVPRGPEVQLPPEITVDITDAWTKLGQLNGHIFVFDKCGKLAYEVITPWSRQMYPFTAMAGLSALYDAPCGECNVTSQAVHEFQEDLAQDVSSRQQNAQAAKEDFEETELPRIKLPLTITIRERHEHVTNGNRVTYDVLELKTNDPNYHGHGESHPETNGEVDRERDKQETLPEEKTGPRDVSQQTDVSATTDQTPQKDQGSYSELLKRYQPLMKWKSCAELVMNVQV